VQGVRQPHSNLSIKDIHRRIGITSPVQAKPVPVVAPITILEIVIRPLSLCMRLFGNMLAGFVVLELLKYFVPLICPIPVSFYFDIFDGLLQAYVFVFLTALFMTEEME